MEVYFKIRDISNLSQMGQEHYFEEILFKKAQLLKTNLVFKCYDTHEIEERDTNKKTYILCHFLITEITNLILLQKKIKEFELHKHFVIFGYLGFNNAPNYL